MSFRWWDCLQILRFHDQQITSPTSSRAQALSTENFWNCPTDAVDLGLLMTLDIIFLLRQMEESALQMVI